MIVPVILAGGTGSRLWPLSRSSYPKQLLSLIGNRTMLQDTILRTQSITNISPPIVICNHEHRFLVAEQLQEIGVQNATIILEPEGKNTAPAAAIAALHQQKDDPILLILPADHFIKNTDSFTSLMNEAVCTAKENRSVIFGVDPTKPETGYGYVKTSHQKNNIYLVEKFVEKPNLKTAVSYLKSGQYYWNSGMFMFRASHYLSELGLYAPAILNKCKQAFSELTKDLDFLRLSREIFGACESKSIDYAIMEKTNNAVLLPLTSDWSDIGSRTALNDTQIPNQEGNVLRGDVVTVSVKNSYLRAESRMLAVVGVSDHIVIETPDAVLVAHKNSAREIKNVVAHLKSTERQEISSHQKVFRPWGYYETLIKSKCFHVKRISIKPYAKLSLQMHQHRSEHWVVVNGVAEVTRDTETFLLSENESAYIPKGSKHRLVNLTPDPLEIIEVQLGTYLGEDDIIRFEDLYNRINELS